MNSHLLFSYGTLQRPHVQLANFGRLLDGTAETLAGYSVDMVEITDRGVLSLSGEKFHPILRFTGDMSDTVVGTAFTVSEIELAQADLYEVEDYHRVAAPLMSGKMAWVYVQRPPIRTDPL